MLSVLMRASMLSLLIDTGLLSLLVKTRMVSVFIEILLSLMLNENHCWWSRYALPCVKEDYPLYCVPDYAPRIAFLRYCLEHGKAPSCPCKRCNNGVSGDRLNASLFERVLVYAAYKKDELDDAIHDYRRMENNVYEVLDEYTKDVDYERMKTMMLESLSKANDELEIKKKDASRAKVLADVLSKVYELVLTPEEKEAEAKGLADFRAILDGTLNSGKK